MQRKIYLILALFAALFLFPDNSYSQVQQGTELGNWQNNSLPEAFYGRYNDVWGIVVNDVEYAVIGSTMGTHFISLEANSAGELPEVAFVPGRSTR